jgi:Leucine-rich repeat (LRR) protein
VLINCELAVNKARHFYLFNHCVDNLLYPSLSCSLIWEVTSWTDSAETTRGLTNLTSLGLEKTNLTKIDKALFVDNTKLKWLLLEENSIQSVDPQALSALKKLDMLSLSNNQLTSLDKNLLQNNQGRRENGRAR